MNVRAIMRVTAILASMTLAGCGWFDKPEANGGATTLGNGTTNGLPADWTPDISDTDTLGGPYGSQEPFDLTRTPVTDATFSPVYFAFDSYLVPQGEAGKVEQAANYLINNPSHVMIIEGHCDERGSNEYNLSLSEQRALGVKTYMINLGIAEERLQTRAYGEERPAVGGNGEETWRLNRRGEFKAYK